MDILQNNTARVHKNTAIILMYKSEDHPLVFKEQLDMFNSYQDLWPEAKELIQQRTDYDSYINGSIWQTLQD